MCYYNGIKVTKDEYNELKDMGQGLMGLIADQRGARIVEVPEIRRGS